MRDHTKLRAFVLADEVVMLIYQITRRFPKEELFGLTSQMRRAGVSAVSNIVEGSSRKSQTDYRRFLEMSFGSTKELHYQFVLSIRLGYAYGSEIELCKKKIEETEIVLAFLIRSLQ